MNGFIYTITDKPTTNQFNVFRRSIHKNCNSQLLIGCPKDIYDWNMSMMFMKIQACLCNMEMFKGKYDSMFVLDSDVIVQDDIFKCIEGIEYDLALTTRHYEYWYPINAGVFAVKLNENTIKLWKFMIDQIEHPTWKPYVDWIQKFKRPIDSIKKRWWCDQDMLCLFWLNREYIRSEFNVNIIDLGPKFNWCPSVEDKDPSSFDRAKKDILNKIGDKEYKILHFKGRLKSLMEDIEEYKNGISTDFNSDVAIWEKCKELKSYIG